MRRGRSHVESAANAARAEVTVFGQDPHGRAQLRGLESEGRRAQGIDGGHIYTGDKGDPSKTFNGPLRTNQTFTGAARMAGAAARRGNIFRDQQGRDIATGVNDEGPFADPTMRIFAARMARRSPL